MEIIDYFIASTISMGGILIAWGYIAFVLKNNK